MLPKFLGSAPPGFLYSISTLCLAPQCRIQKWDRFRRTVWLRLALLFLSFSCCPAPGHDQHSRPAGGPTRELAGSCPRVTPQPCTLHAGIAPGSCTLRHFLQPLLCLVVLPCPALLPGTFDFEVFAQPRAWPNAQAVCSVSCGYVSFGPSAPTGTFAPASVTLPRAPPSRLSHSTAQSPQCVVGQSKQLKEKGAVMAPIGSPHNPVG